MKHLLLAGLLLMGLPALSQTTPTLEAAQPIQAGSISALDTENGFRTYVLGAPVSDYPQFKRKSKDIYVSPKEPLLLENVQLTSLLFTSYQGQLASIAFGALGEDNIEALLSRLTIKYGPSTSSNAVGQTWVGTKATLYVVRVGAGNGEIGMITLKSNELAAAKRAAQK